MFIHKLSCNDTLRVPSATSQHPSSKSCISVATRPEQQPGKAIDIAAEAGAVGQHAVEPAQVAAGRAHHHAHIHHGEERAYAHDVPLPRPEERIAEHHSERHQRRVYTYLHLVKRHTRHRAHGYGESLAGHSDRAAAHLQCYAYAEDGASCHLRGRLCGYACGDEPRCEPHVHVDKRPEHESYKQLEQLHGLKAVVMYICPSSSRKNCAS